jgi:hypothetical protein
MQQFVRGIRLLYDGCGATMFALYAFCAVIAGIGIFEVLGVLTLIAYLAAVAWSIHGCGEIEGGNEIDADYDALRRK